MHLNAIYNNTYTATPVIIAGPVLGAVERGHDAARAADHGVGCGGGWRHVGGVDGDESGHESGQAQPAIQGAHGGGVMIGEGRGTICLVRVRYAWRSTMCLARHDMPGRAGRRL